MSNLKNNHRLVDGPIFKPSFLMYAWLGFEDDNGDNCFLTMSYDKIVQVCAKYRPIEQHIAYAEIAQKGTWD